MEKRKNNKRLLLVSDFFYPHWTGISKSVFSLAKALDGVFAITVLTVRFDKKLAKREQIGNIIVMRSDYCATVSRSKYSLTIIFDFLTLVGKTDYVFLNSPSANILPFSLFAKLFGKKLLIFHQGDLILPEGMLNRMIEKLFAISCFLSFLFADKVSTYTTDYAMHSRVLHPFLKKFTPVLLPVTLGVTTKHLDVIEKLKKEKKIIFGFAGRFVEEKGFDILFRAIPQVMEQLPNAHFVIAGQEMLYENFFGKNKDLLEKVKQHLTFLGLLSGNELQEFYSGIDCIIVPSRSDCFNLVQAEAMLCGTPAIVSDIPGLRYLVKESGFGVLCKPDDPADLAKKIVAFIDDKAVIMRSEKNVAQILDTKKNVEKASAFITS
jgi:glycosyltransferase involved in cell wall biosynthesis